MFKPLIVIVGPTACGKTKLAAKLAANFNGEIISADSRQVFKGMDIGTGKDLIDYIVNGFKVPYHLIDVVSPKTEYNVAKYQKKAYAVIEDILHRGKIPFLVGGTGLYVDAVIQGYVFVPDQRTQQAKKDLRAKLDQLSLTQLLIKLKKVDPQTYQQIDRQNRRRVQRAVEIYELTGQTKSTQVAKVKPAYTTLCLGIKYPLEVIYQRIDNRLQTRVDEGMIDEVKALRKKGVTWQRLDDFGLEYRWVSKYLKGDIDRETMLRELKQAIHHFAKRQLTWFKRHDKIRWIQNYTQAKKIIQDFLKSNTAR